MPTERLTDLVVSIKYEYSDSGLKKATKDIEQFNVKSSDNLNKTNSKFKQLIEYYNGVSSEFSTENKKIASSMTAVNKSINSATSAFKRYEVASKSLKSAKKTQENAVRSLENARLDLIDEGIAEFDKKGRISYSLPPEDLETYQIKKINAFLNAQNNLEKANIAVKKATEANKDAFQIYKQEINNTSSSVNKLIEEEDKFRNKQSLANQVLEEGSQVIDLSIIKLASLIRIFRTFTSAIKRLGSIASKFINASASWVENLNLLEVTFKDNNVEAKEFVEMASENFGLDPNSISQYVSTFKQMANAMGLANDVGTNLSETMSLLALDISSLRNVDIQTAVNDIASGLAGQVKPVRKYGFDITQYSIDALLEELGLGSYSRTMSQSNKIMARSILLLRQSTDAWGDMGKTINTFANQQRVLNDEWQITTRLIGNVLLGTIHLGDSFNDAWKSAGIATRIIWVMNAGLITLNRIIETIVPNTAELGSSALATASDITEAFDEIEDAQDGALANFDKFNTLSSGEGENLGLGNALSELLKKETQKYMEQYEQSLKSINMYADELSTKWMKALGYEQMEENGKTVWKLKDGFTGLASTLELLYSVATAFTGVVLVKLIAKSAKSAEKVAKLSKAFTAVKTALTPTTIAIALIASALAYMYITNEDFRESVNNLLRALSESLGSIISDLSKVLNVLLVPIKGILQVIGDVLTPIFNSLAWILSQDWSRFVLYGMAIVTAIILIKKNLGTLAADIFLNMDNIEAKLQALKKTLKEIFSAKGFVIAGIVLAIANILILIKYFDELKQSGKGIAAIVLGIVGAVMALVAAIMYFKSASKAKTIGMAIAGIVASTAALGLATSVVNKQKVAYKADGGYMTGGLFYAGESGAEWVGRQGNTSTIINDRQMSDIMTEAVAKGVAMGNGFGRTNNTKQAPIVVNVDGKKLFEVVEDRGRNVGKAFARV